jgi:hypothetical protein
VFSTKEVEYFHIASIPLPCCALRVAYRNDNAVAE